MKTTTNLLIYGLTILGIGAWAALSAYLFIQSGGGLDLSSPLQVNWALGCALLDQIANHAANPDLYPLPLHEDLDVQDRIEFLLEHISSEDLSRAAQYYREVGPERGANSIHFIEPLIDPVLVEYVIGFIEHFLPL